MDVKYYDWIAHHANVIGNKVAINDIDSKKIITYEELNSRSSKVASFFFDNLLKKGDRVVILTKNSHHFFEIQFACFKSGAICVPLNWRLTASELIYILGDCMPEIIFYDNEFSSVIEECQKNVNIKKVIKITFNDKNCEYEKEIISKYDDRGLFSSSSHEDVCMIMYTSGTTGHPKGAMINHRMIFYNCVNLGIPSLINDRSIQLVILPLFHTAGLNCYANPILHAGGKIILVRGFDPGRTLSFIGDENYGITHIMAVPAPFQFMMQHPDFAKTNFSRIVRAGVGGAPCAESILRTWLEKKVPLVQGWGMTETSPGATGLDVEDALRKIGSAGKPLLHTEIKIIDENGEKVKPNNIGELVIKGPNVTPGYWNKIDETRNSFTDGWLKTGDAAKEDEDGFLYIVDRWKDMYISGGENVYPAEVENVLYKLDGIVECAVLGVPDDKWGESGKAFIVKKIDSDITSENILNFCQKRLAKYKIPKEIVFSKLPLPRNATGKVLKRELKEKIYFAKEIK